MSMSERSVKSILSASFVFYLVFLPGLNAETFLVRNGAHPWHDRIDRWQLADVPEILQHDEPVAQQSCGSRSITIPAGTSAVVLAAGRPDAGRLVAAGIALHETDLRVTIQDPSGKTKLAYPVFVLRDPPEKIGGSDVCRSGIVLLRLSDEGIESHAMEQPKPLVAPEKSLEERSKFYLYLLIGQSNMAGRGTVEAEDLSINPRVLTLDKDGRWVVALDPIHSDKPVAGVGLGTTFGKIMADKHPEAVIGLIPCAVGGTRVSEWQKDAPPKPPWGELYDNAIARAKIALHDGVLKGILWHQGEGDSSPQGISAYRAKLTRMMTDLRKDLNADGVPFVAGELGVWDTVKHAQRKAFNENLATIGDWFEDASVVSADGLPHRGDGTHFSSKALRELGRRYAEAMLEMEGR